jgi:predicted metallo-beta-lactamase superfamily hydrolase
MKTILEELYDGNIYPDELIVSKDPEYRPLNQEISNTMKIWRSKLSEDDYEQLEALMDLRCKSTSMEASATFMYGFKLGAIIMIEVLTEKEKLVHGGD